MVVGREDLRARARGEEVPSDEVAAVPRGEVMDHRGALGQARRIREADHEVHGTRSCRRWRRGGLCWSRRGWRRSPRRGSVG